MPIYPGIRPVDLTEFHKLQRLLEENEIGYEFDPRSVKFGGKRLVVPNMNTYEHISKMDGTRSVSIICYEGSYGYMKGLLELYAPGLNEGVEGYLTAEKALSYVKRTMNGEKMNSIG